MSTLQEKVSAAASKVGAVAHDARNDHSRYAYTSAAAVLAKCQRALSEQGVAVACDLEVLTDQWLTSQKGQPKWLYAVRATVTLSDGSGETLQSQGIGAGMDVGDKAPMKATTAAYKYALSTALCIALGNDPEADTSSDEGVSAPPKRVGSPQRPKTLNDVAKPKAEQVDKETGEVVALCMDKSSEHAGQKLTDMPSDALVAYHDTVRGWVDKASGDKKAKAQAHLTDVQLEIEGRRMAECES